MKLLRILLVIPFIALALLIPFSAHAQGRVTVTDAQVQKAITELEKLAQNEIDTNAVPGLAIAIVFQDKVVYAKGFGVKDTATQEKIDADTVFQLASVSKPIGSTAIARLVGEGIVTWDSKISDLDPDFEMYDAWVTREITIRDLYAHRSGMPEYGGDLLEDLGFPRAEILHRLRYQKPDSSFRSHYAYSNFGMTEGAVAASKGTGRVWDDLIAEILYQPLGMESTSSRYADFVVRKNRALGHVLVDGKWVAKYKRDPDTEAPAGGVSSSVNDLTKWLRLQLAQGKFDGKQIVEANALAETHKPHMLIGSSAAWGTPSFYGLGWNVGYDDSGRLRLSHSGAFALGAGTNVNMVPSEQLGIVVLTNGFPTGVAEALTATFLDLATEGKTRVDWLKLYKGVFAQLIAAFQSGGEKYAKPPALPSPALKNDAYLGTYTNDYFGDISIIEKDGALAIVQGPQKMTFAMKHFDRDIFTYVTEGESAVGTAGIFFLLGPDGKASAVRVENLDVNGNGTFERVPAK